MAGDSATAAKKNKRIRQEALREQLSAQGHVQHVVDIAEKLGDELPPNDVSRLKTKADIHLRLINKYLPDLKSIELDGDLTINDAKDLSDEELLGIATRGGAGTSK